MRPPLKLRFRSALCLALVCAFTRLQAGDFPELIEPLRRLQKYVGDWEVSWTEDGQLQHGMLQVRPNVGGTLLQSGFTQQVKDKVIWSSVSVYFWRSDLGRLGMFSVDSTGRREESVQTQSGDHEIWQGPGAHDAKGVLETAIAHTDWSGWDHFTWHATHAYRGGRAVPDSPLESYVRRPVRSVQSDSSPARRSARLQGVLRGVAWLVGSWDVEIREADHPRQGTWDFTTAAGGHLLLGSFRSLNAPTPAVDRLDLFYSVPETRGLERFSFSSNGTQGRWACHRLGAHEVWQGIDGHAPEGGMETSVLELERIDRDRFALRQESLWRAGGHHPDLVSRVVRHLP